MTISLYYGHMTVNYGRNQFYNIGPRSEWKTFFEKSVDHPCSNRYGDVKLRKIVDRAGPKSSDPRGRRGRGILDCLSQTCHRYLSFLLSPFKATEDIWAHKKNFFRKLKFRQNFFHASKFQKQF